MVTAWHGKGGNTKEGRGEHCAMAGQAAAGVRQNRACSCGSWQPAGGSLATRPQHCSGQPFLVSILTSWNLQTEKEGRERW